MENFEFDGVEAAQGGSLTMPGTIGIFNISEVEFVKSKEKQTTGMKFTLSAKEILVAGVLTPEESSFNHTFYMTPKALNRTQYLHEVMFDTKLSGTLSEQHLIAAFKGKDVALKVTGQVGDTNGKGYPNLPYAGFAKKVSEFKSNPSILKFSSSEHLEIEEALEAMRKSRSGNADKESGEGAPAAAGAAKSGKAF